MENNYVSTFVEAAGTKQDAFLCLCDVHSTIEQFGGSMAWYLFKCICRSILGLRVSSNSARTSFDEVYRKMFSLLESQSRCHPIFFQKDALNFHHVGGQHL